MVSGKIKQYMLPQEWKFHKAENYFLENGEFKPHSKWVMGIISDKDNHLIYSASMDGTFKLYEWGTLKCLYQDVLASGIGFSCMKFVQEWIFIGTTDGNINLYSLTPERVPWKIL